MFQFVPWNSLAFGSMATCWCGPGPLGPFSGPITRPIVKQCSLTQAFVNILLGWFVSWKVFNANLFSRGDSQEYHISYSFMFAKLENEDCENRRHGLLHGQVCLRVPIERVVSPLIYSPLLWWKDMRTDGISPAYCTLGRPFTRPLLNAQGRGPFFCIDDFD